MVELDSCFKRGGGSLWSLFWWRRCCVWSFESWELFMELNNCWHFAQDQATWLFFNSSMPDSRAQCHCGLKGAELSTGSRVFRKPVVITFPISKKNIYLFNIFMYPNLILWIDGSVCSTRPVFLLAWLPTPTPDSRILRFITLGLGPRKSPSAYWTSPPTPILPPSNPPASGPTTSDFKLFLYTLPPPLLPSFKSLGSRAKSRFIIHVG